MIPLTKEEEDNYDKENTCYICKNDFNNDTNVKHGIIVISQANIGEPHIILVI